MASLRLLTLSHGYQYVLGPVIFALKCHVEQVGALNRVLSLRKLGSTTY